MLLLVISFSLEASHFRYGTISWQRDLSYVSATHKKIIFTVNSTWRWTFPWLSGASPVVGSTISSGLTFNVTGLGSVPFTVTPAPMNLLVTSINSADDYAHTQFIYTAILPNTGFPYTAYFENCCRLSTLSNNADLAFRVETKVTANNTKSPIATLPPIIYLPTNTAAATYPITSIAFDNLSNTYRLATPTEMGGAGLTQAPGLSIVGNNFVMNTVGKGINSIWNGVVIIESVDANGIIGPKIAVDVLFRISGTSTPPSFVSPTPPNSTQLTVRPLTPISFSVSAINAIAGAANTVSLSTASLPSGALFTSIPGNPVNGTFSWTPSLSQIGSYIIIITARDLANVTTSTTVIINVSEDPTFISPTLGDGSILCAIPGETINTTFTALDSTIANTVSLSAQSGALSGMSFSPILPLM